MIDSTAHKERGEHLTCSLHNIQFQKQRTKNVGAMPRQTHTHAHAPPTQKLQCTRARKIYDHRNRIEY